MDLFNAIILGLVQGLTEFLPVSSSGHLVLTQKILGVDDQGVTFEIVLHFGTLLSVIIYFWKPLWRMVLAILPPFKKEYARDRKMIFFLAIARIPAAIGRIFFPRKELLGSGGWRKPAMVGLLLIVTGLLLFLPRLLAKRKRKAGDIGVKSAIAMGLGQAFAILPGVSRSGSTIVAGMVAGAKSSAAASFSFLMAIPAIAAAAVLEVKHLGAIESGVLTSYLVGAVVAFASGLLAIFTVLAAIRKGKFEYFGIYCLVAGAAAFLYFTYGVA
ncbi:UNVERIFIED_CONTAM: hypothetical protein GTU68_002561 [Idotea baltica]|nr:hypothetical protein [Idotea baltica]